VLPRLELVPSVPVALARLVGRRVRASAGSFQIGLGVDATVLAALPRLGELPAPWGRVGIWQVEERVLAESDPARSWPRVWAELAVPAAFHGIPVDPAGDPTGARAAERHAAALAGPPVRGVLDLVVLPLATDGGVAGLRPGSPALRERGDVVALPAQPAVVTLTLSAFARARCLVLVASGADCRAAVQGVLAADLALPASRLRHPDFVLVADEAAAGR